MSALQRRNRDAPDRRSAGMPPAQRDPGTSASTLDGVFDSSPGAAWETWDDVPYEVMNALSIAGHMPLRPFVNGSIPPEPVHGGDRTEYAEAWTVGDDSWTLIEAERPRTKAGARPRPWRLTVRRYRYLGEVKDRYGTVPVDSRVPDSGSEYLQDSEQDQPAVLEVLPTVVRRQILSTVTEPDYEDEFLLQERRKGRPYQHEAGVIRASSRTIIAVHAIRKIETRSRLSAPEAETLLAATPWYVQALTARLGPAEVFSLSVEDDDVALEGGSAIALPPSADLRDRRG